MDWDKQTIEEWNQLGFYYEFHNYLKQWRIIGSNKGLRKLAGLIREYAINDNNKALSEHLHIGPYDYLKVMTWNEPVITKDYIAGSLQDLLLLSSIIDNALSETTAGHINKITTEYSQISTASLVFIVMADDFLPSSIDF